jgi:hypothetical protein
MKAMSSLRLHLNSTPGLVSAASRMWDEMGLNAMVKSSSALKLVRLRNRDIQGKFTACKFRPHGFAYLSSTVSFRPFPAAMMSCNNRAPCIVGSRVPPVCLFGCLGFHPCCCASGSSDASSSSAAFSSSSPFEILRAF